MQMEIASWGGKKKSSYYFFYEKSQSDTCKPSFSLANKKGHVGLKKKLFEKLLVHCNLCIHLFVKSTVTLFFVFLITVGAFEMGQLGWSGPNHWTPADWFPNVPFRLDYMTSPLPLPSTLSHCHFIRKTFNFPKDFSTVLPLVPADSWVCPGSVEANVNPPPSQSQLFFFF